MSVLGSQTAFSEFHALSNHQVSMNITRSKHLILNSNIEIDVLCVMTLYIFAIIYYMPLNRYRVKKHLFANGEVSETVANNIFRLVVFLLNTMWFQ